MSPRFAGIVGLSMLLCVPSAHASAYAYSWQHFTGIRFDNATFDSVLNTAAVNAQFGGYPKDADNAKPDPRLVESGPVSIPTVNDFMQETRVERARADALIATGAAKGYDADGVAEAYRESTGTAAAGVSAISFFFSLTQTSEKPVTVSFDAHPIMHVISGHAGDTAETDIGFVVTFTAAGTRDPLFVWRPDGTGKDFSKPDDSTVTVLSDPFDLQKALSCKDICADDYDKAGLFSISFAYRIGQKYTVDIRWKNTAVVEVVPEPPLPSLVAAAAIGIVLVRSRRRRRVATEPVPSP